MKGAFWAIVIRNSCMEWVLSEQTLEVIRGEGSRNTTRVQALVSHLASTMVTERGFMRIRDQRGTTRTSGCSTLSSWETPSADTHEYHEVKVDNVGRWSEEGGSLAVSLHTPIFFQVQRHFSMSSQAKKGCPTLRSAKAAHIPRGWRCDRPCCAAGTSAGDIIFNRAVPEELYIFMGTCGYFWSVVPRTFGLCHSVRLQDWGHWLS